MFFVIEDDEHNSLASIARNGAGGKSFAEGEQLIPYDLFDAFSAGLSPHPQPGDSRQAIMLVAVGDKKRVF